VSPRRFLRCFATAVLAASALVIPSTVAISTASAQPCPDIDVVFARGTNEAAPVGGVGQPFIDALRSKVGGRSVAVYGVNYPASDDYSKTIDGANDASAHIQSVVANCPDTKIVLGGYSQGAAIVDFLTSPVSLLGFSAPMLPPDVTDHIAAVVVLGNPSVKYAGAPLPALSPVYAAKTIDLCVPLDPLCSGGIGFQFFHGLYQQAGMTEQAANFAASRVA
jgi:cutinase